jgi:hypothetical protein
MCEFSTLLDRYIYLFQRNTSSYSTKRNGKDGLLEMNKDSLKVTESGKPLFHGELAFKTKAPD